MSEPTLGEVLRRLDEVVNKLANLADRLDRDYVRKDVYGEWRDAMLQRLKDVEAEQEKAAGVRRQIFIGLVLAVAGAALSLVLTLTTR